MAHLKQHSIVSTEDHDLSGVSQSGLIMVNTENGGSITVVSAENVASNVKRIVYSGTLNTSLFSSWQEGQHGIAQKSDGSESFHCYKTNGHVYAVEINSVELNYDETDFVLTFNAPFSFGQSQSNNLKVDNQGGGTVSWGDGTTDTISSGVEYLPQHSYSQAGQYAIHLSGDLSWTSFYDSVFKGSSILTEVIIPTGIPELYGSQFEGCNNLTRLEIKEGPTRISGSYFCKNCGSLSTIMLPSSLKQAEGCTFENCTSLTEISLNRMEEVPYSGFIGCTSLSSVSMPCVRTIKSRAFINCSSLSQINIPETCTSIEGSAFAGTAITSVTLPANCTYKSSSFPSGCVITGGILN